MAPIKNGTITGTIPEQRAFAVHYPGYPTSISRAVETLGGDDGMSKARSSESSYLELRFRPEDPFCHPAFGELHVSSGLLLRISKGCRKERQNVEVPSRNSPLTTCQRDRSDGNSELTESVDKTACESNCEELSADIVARIEQSYNFVGMSDYQYVVPVHADLSRRKRRRLVEQCYEKGGLMDMDEEEIMMVVPPLFSLKDMPEDIVLRPSEASRASRKQKDLAEQPWEMSIVPCFNLDFKINEIPPKINWEEKLIKGSADWHLQAAISKLFDERPIWAKATVNDWLVEQGIYLKDFHLRRLLFRTAYYFAYGPFRTLWIRNGYDPRKDPESRAPDDGFPYAKTFKRERSGILTREAASEGWSCLERYLLLQSSAIEKVFISAIV